MQRQRKVLVVSWLHILLALCHMELLVKIQSPFNKALRWACIIKKKLSFALRYAGTVYNLELIVTIMCCNDELSLTMS